MKQIIWSSDALLDETAREYYQNFKREELDDDAYKVSDEEWSDEVYNELGDWRPERARRMRKIHSSIFRRGRFYSSKCQRSLTGRTAGNRILQGNNQACGIEI